MIHLREAFFKARKVKNIVYTKLCTQIISANWRKAPLSQTGSQQGVLNFIQSFSMVVNFLKMDWTRNPALQVDVDNNK